MITKNYNKYISGKTTIICFESDSVYNEIALAVYYTQRIYY